MRCDDPLLMFDLHRHLESLVRMSKSMAKLPEAGQQCSGAEFSIGCPGRPIDLARELRRVSRIALGPEQAQIHDRLPFHLPFTSLMGSLDCTLIVAARVFEFAEGFVGLPTQAIQTSERRRCHIMGCLQCP